MIYKLHSKIYSITLVATKVHVILQSFVVLTWMSVGFDIMEQHKAQHCNV